LVVASKGCSDVTVVLACDGRKAAVEVGPGGAARWLLQNP
jgi:hypothetical protein